MIKRGNIFHTIRVNKSKRTYTIRKYENGKMVAKYRTNVQGKGTMTEDWTENDIRNYLSKYPSDYALVK